MPETWPLSAPHLPCFRGLFKDKSHVCGGGPGDWLSKTTCAHRRLCSPGWCTHCPDFGSSAAKWGNEGSQPKGHCGVTGHSHAAHLEPEKSTSLSGQSTSPADVTAGSLALRLAGKQRELPPLRSFSPQVRTGMGEEGGRILSTAYRIKVFQVQADTRPLGSRLCWTLEAQAESWANKGWVPGVVRDSPIPRARQSVRTLAASQKLEEPCLRGPCPPKSGTLGIRLKRPDRA